MIDWQASNSSPESIRNLQHVVVVCELCGATRTVLYTTAKKNQRHLCVRCAANNRKHYTGEIVQYVCVDCGMMKEAVYNRKAFHNWHCPECSRKIGSGRISNAAKSNWTNQEYITKWKTTNATTREKRSAFSKQLWSDPVRLQNLSDSIKKRWDDEGYRALKTAQSRRLWTEDDYISKQLAGMDKVRGILSELSLKLWQDPVYREKILSYEMSAETRAKLSVTTTALNNARWSDPEFRKKLMDIFTSDEFREKMRIVNKEIVSRPEVKAKMSANAKARWTNYDYRLKLAEARANQSGRISKPQQLLYQYLRDLGVEFYEEGPKTVIGYFNMDCIVPRPGRQSLIIEVQGYWHLSDEAKARDKTKFTIIDRYFPEYEMMYVWEEELYAKDRVLDRLKLALGLQIETKEFEFSDVVIREVAASDVKSFLDAYHYIGKGRGGTCFGAFLGDELVACIVYSAPIRQNISDQFGDGIVKELARFCIHPSYHKKNFGSWLISRTIKLTDADIIVAYADTTVGHKGTIYKAANFILHHEVEPDYWYVSEDNYVMHKRTLYGRAVKRGVTEAEYAAEWGYQKRYGGKKLCFVYQK